MKQYFLADGQGVDSYGTVWQPILLDGPHDSIESVKGTKPLFESITDRKNVNYVIVTIDTDI